MKKIISHIMDINITMQYTKTLGYNFYDWEIFEYLG